MKQRKLYIALGLLVLLVGAYFLFFFDKGNAAADAAEKEGNSADTMDAVDRDMLARQEALRQERLLPASYVVVAIDPKKNLFGESVIEGSLRNKASGTAYKNFELMIYWQDEAGVTMDSAAEKVFANLDPGETVDFRTKRRGPRKSKSIVVQVAAAEVLDK